jgi:tetratricopeptide (TPR) repeat protein
VLAIERKLLQHNLLLLQGMGGAGKTTLLKHLGAWWQETGWAEQVFYFGWDEKAWNLQQIGDTIAGRLLLEARFYSEYRPLSPGGQAAWLAEHLRRERHLLILDNLESITGSPLSIRNTLVPEEQEALRRFLADLRGSKTLVLLGSRGGEAWLAPGTFGANVHELQGLDEEAASALADQVLERAGAKKYREDETLKRLLRLLAGYPLAIQVVLQNLAHQAPQQILEALQAGDVALDAPEGKDKTESILRCIDYSFGNLSPDTQGLLACLAPFTGVVPKMFLPQYSELLQQEPALGHLRFERWEEALHEAEAWGLLTPHETPGYLAVQPTLPYFLRSRFKTMENIQRWDAIEGAFLALYQVIGEALIEECLESGQPLQPIEMKRVLTLVGLEYENLSLALELALVEGISIRSSYKVLSFYFDAMQKHRAGLELGKNVLLIIESFPPETRTGVIGVELVEVVGNEIAKRYLATQQYRLAEEACQKALEFAQGLLDVSDELKAYLCMALYLLMGNIAQEQQKWEEAEAYYQQCLDSATALSDRKFQAGASQHLGMVAQNQQQWGQAEIFYQNTLMILIELKLCEDQGPIYHQLGTLVHSMGRWEDAESYYQCALEIEVKFNDYFSQAKTYGQLGILAQDQQRWEQAETYFQQSLGIFIDFNDTYEQGLAYYHLGCLAEEQSHYEQARLYHLRAIEAFIACEDLYRTDIVIENLAMIWRESGDATLPEAVGRLLSLTAEEVEERFREVLDGGTSAPATPASD